MDQASGGLSAILKDTVVHSVQVAIKKLYKTAVTRKFSQSF